MRAAILMAAGRSRRFGRGDKLHARIGGRSVFAHALACARRSDAIRIVIVSRAKLPIRSSPGIRIVRVPARSDTMSDSLAIGLAALRPIEREVWIFLADMPRAEAPSGVRLHPPQVAMRPVVHGAPGHPMLVRADAARRVLRPGDRGLAALMTTDQIGHWRGKPGNLKDIDDRATLRRYRLRNGR